MSASRDLKNKNPLEELLALLRLMQSPELPKRICKTLTGAVSDNNLELAKKFLAAGSNVNESSFMGSPLSVAAVRGNLELINLLLDAGAKNAGTALAAAAEQGHLAVMNRLLEEPIDLVKDGPPALASAAYHRQTQAVELLLKKGVPLDTDRYHAVGEAARHAAIDVLKVFFAHGLKPEHAGDALRKAAASPLCFVSVKFLVDAGVDPANHPHYHLDFSGNPLPTPRLPADVAAENNQPEVADFLRGKPIDTDALLAREEERRKSWESSDDLEEAIREEHEQKTAHLLRGAARAEAVQLAIRLAARADIKPLLNDTGKDGDTALALAASNGDAEIVSALLAAGADPNQSDGNDHTPPIYYAASNGHTRVVEKLLQGGADPNRKNGRGYAPLVQAAEWDDPEMVKLMLDAGADPKIKEDLSGTTPMMVEPGLHKSTIASLLREAVKKRSGGKPEKGRGLSFVGKKNRVDLATTLGAQDFRKFYYDGHPEWSVAFARKTIVETAKAYAEMSNSVRWETDIAKKKISAARQYVYLIQLAGSNWTIILRSLGYCAEIENEARVLSQRLQTRVCAYQAEDTSGAEDYELFENGESIEKATLCEGLTFTSKLRARQPQFTDDNFPDPVFAEEKIYLPACYPEDDGYDIKLVLKGLAPDDVARADFIVTLD